jgi:hypothetical protein
LNHDHQQVLVDRLKRIEDELTEIWATPGTAESSERFRELSMEKAEIQLELRRLRDERGS